MEFFYNITNDNKCYVTDKNFFALWQKGMVNDMKEKVKVTGVPETMIQTLYARAMETCKKNPKIKDEIAAEIVSKLDYDFSNAKKIRQ